MKKIDYMKPTGFKKIIIKDNTKTALGVPTFEAMERVLYKTIRNA